MKKGILLGVGILGLVLLTGCGPATEGEVTKKSFFIQTQLASGFTNEVKISKPGKISGSQEINTTAQVNGRVKDIKLKEGDQVKEGDVVVQLEDTIANYGLSLQRAKNNLDRTRLTYDKTKITLDKMVADSKLALDKAKNDYEVAKKTSEQTLKQAKQTLGNADDQIKNLQYQFPSQQSTNLNLLNDVLREVDSLLGVTTLYRNQNDSFETYLGVKNTAKKTEASNQLLKLYDTKNKVQNLKTYSMTNNDIVDGTKILFDSYVQINDMLNLMSEVLENSVTSPSYTKTDLATDVATIDGLQVSYQTNNAGFLSYRSLVQNSFNEDGQLSDTYKETAQISYDSSLISAENNIFNAELGVKNAQLAYDTIVKDRDNQLALLQNSINEASISYQDISKTYAKLTVKSPIDGVIGTIYVDEGQEVGMGSPLFTVVSSADQEIQIFVTSEEYAYINVGDEVEVKYEDELYKGTIESISSVADQNSLYKVSVKLTDNVSLLGGVSDIYLTTTADNKVLPINIVTSLKNDKGFVYVLSGSNPEKYDVELGKIWGDYIEITNDIPNDIKVIMTNIDNYDPNKFNIIEKE